MAYPWIWYPTKTLKEDGTMNFINEPMAITHIPQEVFEGKLYRGSMPWTINQKDDQTLTRLKAEKIALIVLLTPAEEWNMCVKCNLKEVYEEGGITVEHFPIKPGQFPEEEKLNELITKIEEAVKGGTNVLIHCVEGKRRTGCVISSFAARVLHISARRAIKLFTAHVGEDIDLGKYYDLIKQFADVEDSEDSIGENEKTEAVLVVPKKEELPKTKKKDKCVIC